MRRLFLVCCCLYLLGVTRTLAQAPVADFSANVTSGCGPLSVKFTDQSTNGPLFWSWDFGNGTTANVQNPSNTYTVPGTYTITLIVRNRSGSDVMRKTDYITVYPYPNPIFNANLTLACSPANIQFSDQSTPGQGSISSWAWTFGDGSTSSQQNPQHTYTQTGYFSVGLVVYNSAGCHNGTTYSRYIRVIDGIQPNFAWNQTSASCSAPFSGNFLNQTAGPGNLSYTWSLGNGAVPANSTDTNPAVTYPANGNYNVTLQVSSSLGCTASLQKTVPFSGNTPTYSGPSSVCVNAPAVFSNTSAPPPTSNHWDFGDGTVSDSATTTKSWLATGSYMVKLVNHYPSCVDSTTQTVQVVNASAPAFIANTNGSCKTPLTVQFTDQTPGSTAWQWDFGDGSAPSTQQNPTHTYTTTGSFNVTLTVTAAGGCANSLTKNAFINIQTPVATITDTYLLGACVDGSSPNNLVNPTSSINAPGGVSTYNWSAPGSDQGSSTAANPSFSYPTVGTYQISFSVTTTDGCTSPVSTATVSIGTPTLATFTVNPPTTCGGGSITFTASQIPADHYAWDFGDGTRSGSITTPSVSHTYRTISPPPMAVTLTLINNGCPTFSTQPINISPPIPNFGFKMVGCPYTVGFIDSSITDHSPSMTYVWDFGDGNTANGTGVQPLPPNPATTHAYAGPGTYTVTLTLTDGATCGPTVITKTITLATVTSSFDAPASACVNQKFTLNVTSGVNPPTPNFIVSHSWQIGGTTYSGGPGDNYTTTLPAVGAYPIILTDTDVNGCYYSSAAKTIQITGPNAKFTVLPDGGGCLNAPIVFTDNSTGYPGAAGPPAIPASTITSWSWNFGDGSSQTYPPGTTYTHQYTDTGTYNVILTVTDNVGCSTADTVPVLVATPRANFGGPDSFYCANTPLTFTDSSRGYGLTYSWDFGDGSGTFATPTHSFPNSGTTYNVTLTVTDQNNCTSTKIKQVRIQSPIAAFNIYDTTAICAPLQTIFAAHGQFYDSLYWSFGDGTTSTLDSTAHFYNSINTYTAKLFLEGPGGCFDSASRRILLIDPNTTVFNYGPVLHCDSVPVNFSITPPAYTLFTLNHGDLTEDSSQNTTPFHMYRNPNVYEPHLYLTDSTGCFVDIPGQQTIVVLGSTPFFALNTHAFCDSSIVQFSDYSISNDGLATETYTFGDGSTPATLTPGNGQFNPSHFYNTAGIMVPTLTISTNSGCTETYTDTIRIHQTPHASITVTSAYCAGLVQFLGDLTTPEQPMDSVAWAWDFSNGQTSKAQAPSVRMQAGNYTVTLRTSVAFGCSDTTSSKITIFPVPVITGPNELTTPVGIPVTIPFTYSNDSIISYNWNPPANLDCPTCPDPVATVIFATQFTVTATDINNCVSTDSILIKTICNADNYFLPNTFSPNGDGVNDYFYPRGTSLYNIQSLTVFNRWGQMVFQRRDFPANAATMGWDGNFNGKPAAADAYVYVAEVICNNGQVVILKGNVTLIR